MRTNGYDIQSSTITSDCDNLDFICQILLLVDNCCESSRTGYIKPVEQFFLLIISDSSNLF